MRTSAALAAVGGRLREAGFEAEAEAVEAAAARVRMIEATLDAVLSAASEPVSFPARRVPGLRLHEQYQAQAAD